VRDEFFPAGRSPHYLWHSVAYEFSNDVSHDWRCDW